MTQLATEINNNMNDEDNFINPKFKMEETMHFFLKIIQHLLLSTYIPHCVSGSRPYVKYVIKVTLTMHAIKI